MYIGIKGSRAGSVDCQNPFIRLTSSDHDGSGMAGTLKLIGEHAVNSNSRPLITLIALLCLSSSSFASTTCTSTDTKQWNSLIDYRPPLDLQSQLAKAGWHAQNIDQAASSETNLDYYSVEITRPPRVGGRELSGNEFWNTLEPA